jgi:nicotinamidase-related amidase
MSYTQPRIESSALITIDVQNDFSLPGAICEVPGTKDAIPNIKRLLDWYRRKALPIIHVVRLYLPDGSNVDACRRIAIQNGARIVAPGSDGAELVETLRPSRSSRLESQELLSGGIQKWANQEVVIYKSRWGAFFQTPLEAHVRSLGVDTLVFCGCKFPNCPRTSIYEASERDFRIVLVDDATSGLYSEARREMGNIGVAIYSTDGFFLQRQGEQGNAADSRKNRS